MKIFNNTTLIFLSFISIYFAKVIKYTEENECSSCDVSNHQIKKQMKTHLNNLKKTKIEASIRDLDSFYNLFVRFLKTRNSNIDWSLIKKADENLIEYNTLCEYERNAKELLKKVAVLKLNGGLGTSMGMNGPKSAIKVKNGETFIELLYKQIQQLNKKHDVELPLILMNSFSTHDETLKIIKNYKGVRTVKQSVFPRISADTLMPIESKEMWYPPGHGDIYTTLIKSGLVDELVESGIEYLFVSNIDNLGATVDIKILNYIVQNNLDFCMEVTKKTRADVKGGTLVYYNGVLTLLELAQVPKEHIKEFTSVRKFTVFNTNSLWINLKAMQNIDLSHFELDIIQNVKFVDNQRIIQLETAMGAAIKNFSNNCGIVVPRSRFLPVKLCSDLMLIESDIYVEKEGCLLYNDNRVTPYNPIIRFSNNDLNKFTTYKKIFKNIPNIIDLESLIIVGNVVFGDNITLKGNIIIIGIDDKTVDIPNNSVLEDQMIVGNVQIDI